MALLTTLKTRVETRVNFLINLANTELGAQLQIPKVQYTLRSTTAGIADAGEWSLRFNPIFLVDNADEYIEHTVGHEVAHLVALSTYGVPIFPHGREWQKVMKLFGLPIKISHRYDLSKVAVTEQWQCGCQKHVVSKRMHAKLLAGELYQCNACETHLSKCPTHAMH